MARTRRPDDVGAQPGEYGPPRGAVPAKPPKTSARSMAETVVVLVVLVVFLRGCLLESFRIPTSSMEPALIGHPYYGDRVIAWKPSLLFGPPERWSINVFVKRPDRHELNDGVTSDRNFIKRVLGLPGERVIIAGGDLFVETAADPTGAIARKPRHVQEAVWHAVYEANASWGQWALDGGFVPVEGECAIRTDGAARSCARFATNHYDDDGGLITNLYLRSSKALMSCPGCGTVSKVGIRTSRSRVSCPNPSCGRSLDVLADDVFSNVERRFVCPNCSQTIEGTAADLADGRCPHCGERKKTQAAAAKTFGVPGRYPPARQLEEAVADVRVSFDVTSERSAGAVGATITVNDRAFVARVDLATSECSVNGPDGVARTQRLPSPLAPGASFRFSFAHVDHAVELELDGRTVLRDEYVRDWRKDAGGPASNSILVAAEGATVVMRRPKIERDLHYMARGDAQWFEYYYVGRGKAEFRQEPARTSPSDGNLGDADAVRTRELDADEYLMMGDNSPSSYDGRMWGPIRRGDFVGEAVFLFWPPNRWRVVD